MGAEGKRAGSETAGKNGPGYKSAPHENRTDILAEGGGFVFRNVAEGRGV